MTNYSRHLGAAALISLLAACGGGGDGPRTVFNYQTFDSTVPGQSRVAAVGLTRSDPDPDGPADGTEVVLGTLDRAPQTLTVTVDNAGAITGIYDPNTEIWTDAGGAKVYANTALTGNFQFTLPVIIEDSDGLNNTYVLGVIARTQDLPSTAGTTTYSGSAIVNGIFSSDGIEPPTKFDSSGDLDLEVSFSTDHVKAIISALSGMPFDSIELTDLQISSGADATFAFDAGSIITFRSGGGTVTPAIGAYTTSANGAFFGGDQNGPVEAGGAFAVDGQTGNIYGIFAADERVNTP